MRYPQFLQKNGTIGFVAPSFGCATEPYRTAFDQAQKVFRQKGYGIRLGRNCYQDKGVGISNSPEECGAELMEAYQEAESDLLISCGGGELMCEILPYMDFEQIKKEKAKWFLGYSDNTNFTFLSATLADTAALYGPCAGAFGIEPWHPYVADHFALLCGEKDCFISYPMWEKESLRDPDHPLAPLNLTEENHLRRYLCEGGQARLLTEEEAPIQLEGRLVGGCMDCLATLLGTEFDGVKEFNDRYQEPILWFLEACDLNPMSIRRTLWQMKHAGWFSHVGAFLIGRPLCFGQEAFGMDHYQAYLSVLAEYGVPVFMDLDLGHLPPALPFVCGASARVTGEGKGLTIQYTWL